MSATPSLSRRLRRRLEAGLMRLLLLVFGMFGVDRASAFGGAMGRMIGPHTAASRVAMRNLRACFPRMAGAERDAIVRDMWDNLGRTVAEYAHLDAFRFDTAQPRIKLIGGEFIDQAVAGGKGGIFTAGHFGNWELPPLAMAQRGLPVMEVYRAASNPLADAIITGLRRDHITPDQAAKGPGGARMMLQWLHQKKYIAMLVDQKLNNGISAPFFGRPAMSPPAAVQLARRFGCPVIPVTIRRTRGARFEMRIEPPIVIPKTADRDHDVLAGVTEINLRLERFIRAYPSQWLWLHRRWPD